MSLALPKVTGLRCVLCSAVYAHGEVEYTCPRCGIEGILDVELEALNVLGPMQIQGYLTGRAAPSTVDLEAEEASA